MVACPPSRVIVAGGTGGGGPSMTIPGATATAPGSAGSPATGCADAAAARPRTAAIRIDGTHPARIIAANRAPARRTSGTKTAVTRRRRLETCLFSWCCPGMVVIGAGLRIGVRPPPPACCDDTPAGRWMTAGARSRRRSRPGRRHRRAVGWRILRTLQGAQAAVSAMQEPADRPAHKTAYASSMSRRIAAVVGTTETRESAASGQGSAWNGEGISARPSQQGCANRR